MHPPVIVRTRGGRVNILKSAEASGVSHYLVRLRLRRGWELARALSTPSDKRFSTPPASEYVPTPPRFPLRVWLSLEDAKRIAGTLGRNTKMPGYAYGLDAFQCIAGSKLAAIPGSTCESCYARSAFYEHWNAAKIARARRHAGLDHPRWADAMVTQIERFCTGRDSYFRWHDSGDLMSEKHFSNICEVARRTPAVKHWLPTREYEFVEAYLKAGGVIPPNLCVRLSAHMVGQRPRLVTRLRVLPTSTVHLHGEKPVAVDKVRHHTIACRAPENENQCGNCRACWSPRVQNVSYTKH